MACSEDSGANREDVDSGVREKGSIYEDEIALINYFLVPWKRKWFVFFASVLPALLVALAIFLGPRDYKISYTYNIRLDEKTFKTLKDKFYSTENLEKLIGKLQEDGFEKCAKKLAETKTAEGLKAFVSFEISPRYFEAIELSKVKDWGDLEKIQQVRGTLLEMQIESQSREDIRAIASVCRENFEQVIPLYSEKEELSTKTISLKEKMADIEEARYALNLELERKKSTLGKLKESGPEDLGKLPTDLVLQFNNVDSSSAYLPLPYQVQAAETQIINLEEEVRANKENYDYYADLLKLNETLLSYVKEVMPSHSTLEQFHSFLTQALGKYDQSNEHLLDYLKAYIKRIENKIANVIPLVERPNVYPAAKGTIKKSGIVFAIALMLSVFGAFFLEGLKQNKMRNEK
jgi:hypothetical protein